MEVSFATLAVCTAGACAAWLLLWFAWNVVSVGRRLRALTIPGPPVKNPVTGTHTCTIAGTFEVKVVIYDFVDGDLNAARSALCKQEPLQRCNLQSIALRGACCVNSVAEFSVTNYDIS